MTLPARQAFFSSSLITWFHPISAAFSLGIGRSYTFAARVGDTASSVLLHPLGWAPTGQTGKPIRFSEPQKIYDVAKFKSLCTSVDTNPTFGQGQVFLTSVIKWELIKQSSHPTPSNTIWCWFIDLKKIMLSLYMKIKI